jgi:hypothetical protein
MFYLFVKKMFRIANHPHPEIIATLAMSANNNINFIKIIFPFCHCIHIAVLLSCTLPDDTKPSVLPVHWLLFRAKYPKQVAG